MRIIVADADQGGDIVRVYVSNDGPYTFSTQQKDAKRYNDARDIVAQFAPLGFRVVKLVSKR